jgi:hypothetical protein
MILLHIINFATTAINPNPLPHVAASRAELQTILAIVFGIVGALSVLFITISGMRYILSNGDPQKAARAKDGIIYALVGIVIAISAEAIVAFVIGNI